MIRRSSVTGSCSVYDQMGPEPEDNSGPEVGPSSIVWGTETEFSCFMIRRRSVTGSCSVYDQTGPEPEEGCFRIRRMVWTGSYAPGSEGWSGPEVMLQDQKDGLDRKLNPVG
jgi:hypothetical protein